MKNLLLGAIVGASMLAYSLPALADSVTTSTQTIHEPPVVIDSYMKPTVMQTKTITAEDGTVRTDTSPMVLERHEKVQVPIDEVRTTTTTSEPRVTVEESSRTIMNKSCSHRAVRHVAYRPTAKPIHHRHFVASRRTGNRTIAENIHVKRTTVMEPQVTTETRTTRSEDLYVDRRDPALDDF